MYRKKEWILIFVLIICGLGTTKVNKYSINECYELKLIETTKAIGKISTNNIFIIDLLSGEYSEVSLLNKTSDNNGGHLDIFFLTNKVGDRIAEFMVNPSEKKLVIKYTFGKCILILYDPSTGESCYLQEGYTTKNWHKYEIKVNYYKEKIEITEKGVY